MEISVGTATVPGGQKCIEVPLYIDFQSSYVCMLSCLFGTRPLCNAAMTLRGPVMKSR